MLTDVQPPFLATPLVSLKVGSIRRLRVRKLRTFDSRLPERSLLTWEFHPSFVYNLEFDAAVLSHLPRRVTHMLRMRTSCIHVSVRIYYDLYVYLYVCIRDDTCKPRRPRDPSNQVPRVPEAPAAGAHTGASTHPCIHASMHPCVHASMRPFIHSSIHPFIHSSIHPSFHSSICLSLPLFLSLSLSLDFPLYSTRMCYICGSRPPPHGQPRFTPRELVGGRPAPRACPEPLTMRTGPVL